MNLFKIFRRKTYPVSSLGGEPMPDKEIVEALHDASKTKSFRAVIQILEDELNLMRQEACNPERLKEGTQAHYNGAVDALNGALLRIAEVVLSSQKEEPPASKKRRFTMDRVE